MSAMSGKRASKCHGQNPPYSCIPRSSSACGPESNNHQRKISVKKLLKEVPAPELTSLGKIISLQEDDGRPL
jgi:hypothetical protein